jgi:hypothetical protein
MGPQPMGKVPDLRRLAGRVAPPSTVLGSWLWAFLGWCLFAAMVGGRTVALPHAGAAAAGESAAGSGVGRSPAGDHLRPAAGHDGRPAGHMNHVIGDHHVASAGTGLAMSFRSGAEARRSWRKAFHGLAPATTQFPGPFLAFLCLFASLSSLATVAAIQIQKSNNYEEHIVRAQGVRAALEVLEVSITSGNLTTRKATSQFLKCLEDCSFMEPIH